ncbi:putative transcription factor interactor and regulator CCHC(Zn) family [Helianthus annuus]|uniref:Transcription factor interactor and regulator CCHC(Zn) family n=1 Tax=Helianthus annuus TaxID=4232 RepID=A0A9K3IKV8_HELAN|nr:putative transcription factor interactor and regulator CCHC(Zn) family [Helianthus annuus]KAJ0556967.1 putative transcription factor interactor and regulator CCHC(Zn) family [Helianthus annuus]KAJ0904824.1 putative transcription factor interactor and regulator CCHC(Zn) family [Helianthus annuus]
MCFICGGPHYTKYCPNDSGCSIDFDVNPLVQPQSYQSWNGQPERTPEDFRDWVKAAKEERERGIRAALDSLNSQSSKSQGRYTYDINGNYLGYQTADGEMDYTILDPGGEMCIEISQSGKYYDSSFNYYNSHESDLPLSCENDVVQVSHSEPLYEEDEDHTHEPETIMDVEVPPLVQQVVNSSYWCPTPWDIYDGFWSDDDEGVVEEAKLEVPDYTTARDEEVCEPLDKMEDEKLEHVPSWEEEFGDELVGLPTLEYEEFDPVGDLAYLETLLVETPTMEIKYTPNVKEEVAEEFDSWPMKDLDVGSPSYIKSREKAQRNLDQHSLRVQRWYKRKLNGTLKCTENHSPHYMPRIKFGPGKFKYWWVDPFEYSRLFFNFTNDFLLKTSKRVELNGLDRGWIKEKPPD